MSRLEQRRAAFALSKVDAVRKEQEARKKDKYRTQLVKLPARLHTNGLGQTVAFYLSAGPDRVETTICGWIEEWLREAEVYPTEPSLISCITGGEGGNDEEVAGRYRQASAEARALATWLKRFAEAFLVEAEEESDVGQAAGNGE